MSFAIKCNKCGTVVPELKDWNESYSDNECLSDKEESITVSSIADWHGSSGLSIVCKCGNQE